MGRVAWCLTIVLMALPVAATAADARIRASIDESTSAELDRDFAISILAIPADGDAWSRLSLRLTGDASNWKKLADFNGRGENLLRGVPVRVPWQLMRTELREKAVSALFPSDARGEGGWVHVVKAGSDLEGEPLWNIAEWFTGDPMNYRRIRDANPSVELTTRVGQKVVIPNELLLPGLRGRGNPALTASSAPAKPQIPAMVASTPPPMVNASTADAAPVELTYTGSGSSGSAIYRLKPGEALWSSVVVRFTGRVFSKDVNEAIERIVAENSIADVSRIPAGAPIRIPLDLLMPEYLPAEDARRVAYERSVAESTRAGRRIRVRNLEGVHVIIDPGHGGRDVGTVHDDLWESTHVYDVAMHLKAKLESSSGAKVWLTTRSADGGFRRSTRDELRNRTDHVVLTTPHYRLDDAVVGVNLRWYLANSVYRRLIEESVPPEKIVFLSIHADSLHPSLRGAMAYIPGNRYVTGTYRKSGDVYLARAEVRESPEVEQRADEALRAEGLSRELAASIMGAFSNQGLAVHPYKPVRDNIVREGREWVPAVIRYNKVPTRLLLEICNLGNEEDRRLVQTVGHRKAIADAVYRGIVDFFATREDPPLQPEVVRTAAAE